MKTKRNFLALLAASAVLAIPAFSTTAAVAATEAHSHEETAAAHALQLDHGKKWASDAPLRQSMAVIAREVTHALPVVHDGKMTAAGFDALAKNVELQVAHIVSNCKLEPAADEALHVILAGLLEGNEAMQGKGAKVSRTDGVVQVVHALGQYAEYFEHPGFEAPKAGH